MRLCAPSAHHRPALAQPLRKRGKSTPTLTFGAPMTTPAVLISAAELDTLMQSEPTVVIDTRDADTFAAGHIPGAV